MSKEKIYEHFLNLNYNRITKKQKNKTRKYIADSLRGMYQLEENHDKYTFLKFIPCNCYNIESENPNYKVLLTAHYDTHIFRQNIIQSYITRKIQSWNFKMKFLLCMLLSIIFSIFPYITEKYSGLNSIFSFILSFMIISLLMLGFPTRFLNGSRSFNSAPIHDDNNSGVITLIYIAELLYKKGYNNKIKLLFTDNEEKGLFGSKLFVNNNIDNLNDKIIINFDCVGRGSNIFITSNSNSKLAKELQCFFYSKNIDTILSTKVNSDDKSFQKKNLNAIGISRGDKDSKSNNLLHWTHTSHDTLDKINIDYISELVEVIVEFIEQI